VDLVDIALEVRMTTVHTATMAWRHAHGALDEVCSSLAGVPGANIQYEALCRLTREFQARAGQIVSDAASRAADLSSSAYLRAYVDSIGEPEVNAKQLDRLGCAMRRAFQDEAKAQDGKGG
jgi:hypothetical protein